MLYYIKYFPVVVVDETLRATWFKEFSTTDKSKEEFVYNVSSGIEYRGVQTRGDRGCLHFYWHTTMSCLLVLSAVTLVPATQQINLKSFKWIQICLYLLNLSLYPHCSVSTPAPRFATPTTLPWCPATSSLSLMGTACWATMSWKTGQQPYLGQHRA